jgi:hypothetical protein
MGAGYTSVAVTRTLVNPVKRRVASRGASHSCHHRTITVHSGVSVRSPYRRARAKETKLGRRRVEPKVEAKILG